MPPKVKGKNVDLVAILVSSFAAFGGFLYGYDTGYISGVKAMPGWLQHFGTFVEPTGPNSVSTYELSSGRDSLVTSILSVGTFFGSLFAFPVGDRFGRRVGIWFFLVLFCIGVACQTGSTALPSFVVGRVFAGLGVGGTSCLVPIYQAEVAPRHIRGAIVAGYQWMITIGLLIAACVVQGTKDMDSEASYRIPIGIQFIWAFILAMGLLVLPESPRWLLVQGREKQALRSLSRLLSAPEDSEVVLEEYHEILANVHHEKSLGKTSYIDCFRGGEGKNRLRVGTGVVLQALQQLTGINFIFYYGTTFFQNSGINRPFLTTIITNIVNVVMTIPGQWAAEHVGRRRMLLAGALLMALFQMLVALIGDVRTIEGATSKAMIALICFFIASFASTWGILAWVVTSEIYPNSIRAKAMSLSTASNWLWNFGIGYATPYLVDVKPGSAGLQTNVFWIWGGCCFIGFFFVYFFIPETRLLSLEQVDILYRNSNILNADKYRRQILAENVHDEESIEEKPISDTNSSHIQQDKPAAAHLNSAD